MYAVDLDAIHDFRLKYCQVINVENDTESSNHLVGSESKA
jgi:hypothetical protein